MNNKKNKKKKKSNVLGKYEEGKYSLKKKSAFVQIVYT
jgi:hypothetical protein